MEEIADEEKDEENEDMVKNSVPTLQDKLEVEEVSENEIHEEHHQYNDRSENNTDDDDDEVDDTAGGILSSLRNFIGMYTDINQEYADATSTTTSNKDNDDIVFQLKDANFEDAVVLITEEEISTFSNDLQDLKIEYGTNVWLDLEGDHYWTAQSEKEAANNYKSEVVANTRDEISPNMTTSDQPGHITYVNQNYKKLINVNQAEAREDYDLLLTLVLYSTAPMSPKAAMKQKDPYLVAAAEKAIKEERKSLIENGVLKTVRWSQIPKDKRYRILRAFTFVANKARTLLEEHHQYDDLIIMMMLQIY